MLKFGTAGIPEGAKSYEEGFEIINRMGLDSLEVEFVHGVRMKEARAREVGQLAQQKGVTLTCHGPYYINLNAAEEEKKLASIQRVKNTIEAGQKLGAESITFHAGFYLKQDPEKVKTTIKQALTNIMNSYSGQTIPLVSPETTGKPSQFGSIEELTDIAKDIPGLSVCVDFSHMYTRSIGGYNTEKDIESIFVRIIDTLGEKALKHLHCHMAGIVYGPKGEKHHVNLEKTDFNYKAVLRVMKAFNVSGIVTCESPNLQIDALHMKETYETI